MTRFFKSLGVGSLAVAAFALMIGLLHIPADAQVNPYKVLVVPSAGVNSHSTYVVAVDTAPVMLVKYIGPTVQANTFAVTTFDYIFTVAGSADATINVQATTPCGASVGTLDTNDSDCNTLGELVNEINASANWLAIPLGGISTDSVDTGGQASGADVAAAVALAAGTPVYIDSSDALTTALTFYPKNRLDIRDWMQGNKPMNPFEGRVSTLQYYLQNVAETAAGAGNVYAVHDHWGGLYGKTWTQDIRILYGFTGAATGVDKAIDFTNGPLFTNPGERIIVRGASTVTHTSPRFVAFGFSVTQ